MGRDPVRPDTRAPLLCVRFWNDSHDSRGAVQSIDNTGTRAKAHGFRQLVASHSSCARIECDRYHPISLQRHRVLA
jgi:hypothetical protein